MEEHMVQLMLCCGLILLICITSSKVLYKFGVPLLLIFIFLGMIFGEELYRGDIKKVDSIKEFLSLKVGN